MLSFVFPTAAHREDVHAFYAAFEAAGETCIGYGGWQDFDRWLAGMQNRKTATDLPEGYVRENFYLVYDGDEMIGVFSLKFELTPYLFDFGGHIGYAVTPARRNRGLATATLAQGLTLARSLGFSKLLLVCDEDNPASERVIVKNGGVFEDTRYDPDEEVRVHRYWITL